MKIEKIKKMMEVCYMAKRIRELLPKLPEGVTSSYIRYLDVIHQLECRNGRVKISDVSTMLNLPRPGVTRTVKEMEAKGHRRKTDVLCILQSRMRERKYPRHITDNFLAVCQNR